MDDQGLFIVQGKYIDGFVTNVSGDQAKCMKSVVDHSQALFGNIQAVVADHMSEEMLKWVKPYYTLTWPPDEQTMIFCLCVNVGEDPGEQHIIFRIQLDTRLKSGKIKLNPEILYRQLFNDITNTIYQYAVIGALVNLYSGEQSVPRTTEAGEEITIKLVDLVSDLNNPWKKMGGVEDAKIIQMQSNK